MHLLFERFMVTILEVNCQDVQGASTCSIAIERASDYRGQNTSRSVPG